MVVFAGQASGRQFNRWIYDRSCLNARAARVGEGRGMMMRDHSRSRRMSGVRMRGAHRNHRRQA